MPITADRMQKVIDLANQILDINAKLKLTFRNLNYDFSILENKLNEQEREKFGDLIYSIQNSIRFVLGMEVSEDLVKNLMYEKSWFEINQKKNKAHKWRMRLVREGIIIPKKQQNPRKKGDININYSDFRRMTQEEINADYKQWLETEKQKRENGEEYDETIDILEKPEPKRESINESPYEPLRFKTEE